ncbi:hypothetical protein Vafri_19426 [Volvox africanus]|uniref:Uncharacterized protein n=1 Tax=Volvox africanus TaxID=51714 RepID=A0A8J4BP06_9CHLO|nr:hypothetical protein Vafri_19426 [Volvox africanus]
MMMAGTKFRNMYDKSICTPAHVCRTSSNVRPSRTSASRSRRSFHRTRPLSSSSPCPKTSPSKIRNITQAFFSIPPRPKRPREAAVSLAQPQRGEGRQVGASLDGLIWQGAKYGNCGCRSTEFPEIDGFSENLHFVSGDGSEMDSLLDPESEIRGI